jgi:predicted HicB family RNase H-like nuclease
MEENANRPAPVEYTSSAAAPTRKPTATSVAKMITPRIPPALAERAKRLAAERGTSVNRLVIGLLEIACGSVDQ